MIVFVRRSLFCLILLGVNCGRCSGPIPEEPSDALTNFEICWDVAEGPPVEVGDTDQFLKDLGSLSACLQLWAIQEDRKNFPDDTNCKEFKFFRERMRLLIGREYELTLNVVDIRDGWVLFAPLTSQPIQERLFKLELARAGHQQARDGLRMKPAVVAVFDFSGRDHGDNILPAKELPEHLRKEGLSPWRLPARAFPTGLLRALGGDKLTFRIHIRIASVTYVAGKHLADFTTVLFSVRLRTMCE
jgi:hypothetical protein